MVLFASCQPGLEGMLRAELRAGGHAARPAGPGLVRVEASVGQAEVLAALRLRTADDLYLELWSATGAAVDRALARPALALPGEVLAAGRAVLLAAGRRPSGRFKVSCFLHGRADLQRRAVERRLQAQVLTTYPTWQPDAARPDTEIVAFLTGPAGLVALRLTDPAFRHRGYLRAPGALSPTVAAALVRLSGPEPSDRFLDPCCGGGTILVERAMAGPHAALLGGDIAPEAVAIARDNLGAKHRPWSVQVWDARRLPLPDGAADRVVTNLPFGLQIEAPGGVRALAAAVATEAARVLRPGGRLVALWPAAPEIGDIPGLAPVQRLPFALAGQPVAARVFDRLATGT